MKTVYYDTNIVYFLLNKYWWAIILWAKICEIDSFLILVQYGTFALKIQKNRGKNFY